jgi:hypothetical protein
MMPHWADEAADRILGAVPAPGGGAAPVAPRRGPHRISTGISPSGPIHVGNLRETLTGDAVARVLRERGADVRLEFVADDFDPLRRVYPFLDAKVYEPLIGRPLSEIPCPCGDHPSYADHFLRPYLETLKELAIDLHLERGSDMYKSGRMNKAIVRALEKQLNFGIRIVGAPTIRDPDGLAMSSRNAYLTREERAQAAGLQQNLRRIKALVEGGRRDYDALVQGAVSDLTAAGWRVDYVAVRNRSALAVPGAADKDLVILAAAWLGKTRLIDNLEADL